jgi:ubiquinone/menaquinone biosynthesis C-methylase UbiE
MNKYAKYLHRIAPFRETAINAAIEELKLPAGSNGLDAGCGIGTYSIKLAEIVQPEGKVTGLDISPDMLNVARDTADKSLTADAIEFIPGDLLHLPFEDNNFDWTWCMDTLWPASPARGKDGNGFSDPGAGVRELKRVTKPGGKIALLFWSAQSLLPGYPRLELRLLEAFYENTFYVNVPRPEGNFLRALNWLQSEGIENAQAKCFASGVQAPLSDAMKESLQACFDMFYEDYIAHIQKDDWELVQRLCRPDSDDYILNSPDYYAFVVYSLFYGIKG